MEKKRKKTRIICCAAAFALIAAAVLARILFLYFAVLGDEEFSEQQMETTVEEIAGGNGHIDYSGKDGLVYINNELLVTAKPDAKEEDINALAEKAGAAADPSMAGIGVYRFVFGKSLSREQLENKIEEIESEEIIEDVQLSIVSMNGPGAAEKQEPVRRGLLFSSPAKLVYMRI